MGEGDLFHLRPFFILTVYTPIENLLFFLDLNLGMSDTLHHRKIAK